MLYLVKQRTAAAQDAGYYDDEIVPMNTVMKLVNKESGEEKDVEVTVDRDDCNRPETTIEGLSSLKPVFDPENWFSYSRKLITII